MNRRALPAVVVALAACGAADSAQAAEVHGGPHGTSRLHYTAGAGEANQVSMELQPDGTTVRVEEHNPAVPLVVGSGCTPDGPNAATCPAAKYTFVELLELDDTLDVALNATIMDAELGDGDDRALTRGDERGNVRGGAGIDRLSDEGAGSPILSGGADNDVLDGAAVRGEDGNDQVSHRGGDGYATGGEGDDYLFGHNLFGQGGNDWMIGSGRGGAGDDVLEGTDGADFLAGEDGDDEISGRAGDDVLLGGLGADGLAGGAGDDEVNGAGSDDVLSGGSGADALRGGGGGDVLYGQEGDDLLLGDATAGDPAGASTPPGGDSLYGGDGADVLSGDGPQDGGGGAAITADTLRGDAGVDSLSYAGRTAAVRVTLDDRADDGQAGEGDDAGADLEIVTTGPGADTVASTDSANRIATGAGADAIAAEGGADTIASGPGADQVSAGDGDDRVTGGTEADTLNGDGGADLVQGDRGGDEIDGGAGDDDLIGDALNSTDGEADTIRGGDGNDGLDGTAGDDTLTGGPGQDGHVGGTGADRIDSDDGARDDVSCGGQTDTVTADFLDTVQGDCESVSVRAAPAQPAAPGGPAAPAQPGPSAGGGALATAVRFTRPTRRGLLRRGLLVKVACRNACGARASLRLTRRGHRTRRLGRVDRVRTSAGTLRLRVRLTRSGARALRRARRPRLTLVVRVVDGNGAPQVVRRRFRLR
jgi:Ca2+-binding RTX toxin-like protein